MNKKFVIVFLAVLLLSCFSISSYAVEVTDAGIKSLCYLGESNGDQGKALNFLDIDNDVEIQFDTTQLSSSVMDSVKLHAKVGQCYIVRNYLENVLEFTLYYDYDVKMNKDKVKSLILRNGSEYEDIELSSCADTLVGGETEGVQAGGSAVASSTTGGGIKIPPPPDCVAIREPIFCGCFWDVDGNPKNYKFLYPQEGESDCSSWRAMFEGTFIEFYTRNMYTPVIPKRIPKIGVQWYMPFIW